MLRRRALVQRIFKLTVQLQLQTLLQAVGPHAHGLQVVQQAARHGEAVHQLFQFVNLRSPQAAGQVLQAVGQVTVVVQALDQVAQGGAVFGAQAQAQCLAVQVGLQAFMLALALGRVGGFLVLGAVAGPGFHAPLAVVGGQGAAAIALPVGLGLRNGRGFFVKITARPRFHCVRSY